MVDITKNFTIDVPDSEGRYLVGDNHVLFISYYSSLGEGWVRDYANENAVVNPFVNADFSGTTVSGTARGSAGPGWYELGADSTVADTDRYFKVFKVPYEWEEELFAQYATVHENSTVVAGSVHSVTGDYFIDANAFTTPPKNVFPDNYLVGMSTDVAHATSSGTLTGPYAYLTYDFGSNPQEVAGFYIDSFSRNGLSGAAASSSRVGEYIIETAVSGTGLLNSPDFSVLASGVIQQTDPFWLEVEPTLAKYVRLRYKNNGHVSRTTLMKFWSFSSETINKGYAFGMTKVFNHQETANGRTLTFNQDVDFSGVNRIYLDFKDFAELSGDLLDIYIGGTLQSELAYPQQNPVGGGSNEFLKIRGLSVDVSPFTATTFTLQLRAQNFFGGNPKFFAMNRVYVHPSWYDESPSSKRGSQSGFPNEVLFTVDRSGMSIIDVSQFPGVNEINPKLWMRFDLGPTKMLQQIPRSISATEGRVYMATSRGLFVLDFTDNVCCRFDERGPWRRYGLDYRNDNHYDLGSITTDTSIPHRDLHTFVRFTDTPVIPELDLYAVASAVDDTYGRFAVIGSSSGLLFFNDQLDSTAEFLTSSCKLPVRHVEISDGVVWYIQGEGTAARLCRIDDVNTLADGFVPDEIYHQDAVLSDPLQGDINTSNWRVVDQDPEMTIQTGDFLTISGTHTRGGATGIISRNFYADRDFSAKVDVRIREFPDDARGGLRFGFAKDYRDAGHRSVYNVFGNSARNGFFLSALNVDPVGGHLLESAPFEDVGWEYNRGWTPERTDRSTGDINDPSYITSTSGGIYVKGFSRDQFSGGDDLVRVVSSWPTIMRKFTARLDTQIVSGFSPITAALGSNAGAWLGLGHRFRIFPGTFAGGDHINMAMQLAANTSVSGVSFYTVGRYDINGSFHNTVTDNNLILPIGSTENTGAVTSPFREWRIDYDLAGSSLTAYIDGELINTIEQDQFPQPPVMGLGFGIYHRSNNILDIRETFFRNLRIDYPTLNPNSRGKYALELVNNTSGFGRGGIHNNLTSFTTYSGVSLAGDSTPASSVLGLNSSLADGNLHTGGVTISPSTSVGVALLGTETVEALYLYDTNPSTDGWSTTSNKRVGVWSSSDNSAWALVDEYDLNALERTSGVTKLPLEPAVDAAYIKVNAVDSPASNYNVGGGGSWVVSEIQPITISGATFSGTDATASADFREWRLDYSSETREIKGYIDSVLVSVTTLPNTLEEGQFVLVHDLSPVSSGTAQPFCADFRNLEVTFTGDTLPAGDITSFYVQPNSTGPNSTNHTIMAATVSGLYVTDIELGSGATLPNTTKVFVGDDIFGFSQRVNASFADSIAQRDDGLIFIGTGGWRPSYFSRRFNKPFWIEREKDPTSGDEIDFGGTLSFSYHPGRKAATLIFGRNAGYISLIDFDREEWIPVSRGTIVEEYNVTQGDFATEAAKLEYSHYDDLMWYLASPTRLCTFDVYTGQHTRKFPDAGVSIGTDNGHYFLSYVLHDHTLVYGVDFLERWDVAGDTDHLHPRNWATDPQRWNRSKASIPWNAGTGFQGGHADALYCEYDKHVYFIGAQTSDFTSDSLFYRYDPDKDYVEEIISGAEVDTPWPVTDEELATQMPLFLIESKKSWLVYEPFLRRIYIIGSRSTEVQFYYYDVVEQKLVYPGESPSYVSIRDWPDSTAAAIAGVSHATYDLNRKSILLYGRAGKDQTLLEYIPEKDDFYLGFEYIPARDGLPTSSGITKHFTRNSQPFLSNYGVDSTSFQRDFYKTRTNSSSQEDGMVNYRYEGDYLVISGAVNNTSTTHDRSMWISSAKVDGTSSFDFSATIAMPKWSNNIFHSGADSAVNTEAFFSLVIQDGLNPAFVATVESTLGRQSADIYQAIEVRAGVSGTLNDLATSYPFTGHLLYSDAQSLNTSPSAQPHIITSTYDTYLNGGLDLGTGGFADFKEFRISYDYDNDRAEAFIDGTSVGTTTLKRKFTSDVRLGLKYSLTAENAVSNDTYWIAHVKDLKYTPKAWEYVENNRLITSISGSVGSYFHERWDSTLVSGTDWVYQTNAYLPTSRSFAGYSYICSLAGIGDGHKLVELAAIVGPSSKKQIGLTGDLNGRYDRTTFLGVIDHIWDDIDLGKYKIVKNTQAGTVEVFIGESTSPAISVDYDSLPSYNYKHVYYGKVDYGDFERIYAADTYTETWVSQPDFTGLNDPVIAKERWGNSSTYAQFATVDQFAPPATATYNLDANLGEVDLYVFYVASGFDLAANTPHTVFSSGVVTLPPTGVATVVSSIDTATDHLGNVDTSATTIRVDQRRTFDNRLTVTAKARLESSGWVYLGRYIDPTTVIVTSDAEVATSSSQGFVCAGAVGVDVGRRGKSTADLSISEVHYIVGQTEFNATALNRSGVSVIDLDGQELIDFYGTETIPAFPGDTITSGDKLES